jgi:Holliday junction resolvasome RuvABC endonuclease subunit
MLIIGVDPGVGGALAAVSLHQSRLIGALNMPVIRYETQTRVAVDPRAVAAWIETLPAMPDHVVVEHQQPFGKEGRTTTFILGAMFGAVVSVLSGYGWPISFTVPTSWKRAAGLTNRPKPDALQIARQRFGICPELAITRGEVNQEQAIARADAALVAWFGLPKQLRVDQLVARPPRSSQPIPRRRKPKPMTLPGMEGGPE